MHQGNKSGTAWGCDLTYDYVKLMHYIQHRGNKMNQIIVIKMGGIAIKHLSKNTIMQIKNWIKQNDQIIIVHGGGNVIESLLMKANHPTVKKDGLRVTAKEDLPIIKDALFNHVGQKLTSDLKAANLNVKQLREDQLSIIQADYLNYQHYGSVGKNIQVNVNAIQNYLIQNMIPVISSIGTHQDGELININADHLAIAIAMKARKLILMTDVKGVIEHGTLIKRLNINHVQSKIDNHIITGGMIPKINSAVSTVKSGVQEVIIGDNLLTGTIIEGTSNELLISKLQKSKCRIR